MRKLLVVVAVAIVAILVVWKLWHRGGGDTPVAGNGPGSAKAMRAGKRAAAATPASVSGRVTRKSDGVGVPDAVVALTKADMLDNMQSDSPRLVAITDANGAWTAAKVPPGGYVIAATATTFLPATLPKIWVAAGEQHGGVDLVLESGGTLVRGTVTDIGGGPIPGARISIHDDERFDWQRADFMAVTGSDGTYQLSLADGSYAATASHDEYTHASHDLEVAGKPVTLDFQLTPGGIIRGQVIAKDTNKPVPHAMVTASSRQGRGGGGMPDATTDDDGNFTIKSLKPGVIALTASARGYASATPTTVELGIGEQEDGVRVMVDHAFSISGHVVKKGTKDGLPGVRVGAFAMSQGRQAMDPDPTDAEGAFEIVGVKPGNYFLFAFGEASVPEVGKPIDVVDKDVAGLVLELQTGVTVTGRVEPPQVAALSLELAGEVGIANIFEAVKTMAVHADSDSQGTFTLHNVPTGAFKLTARAPAGPVGSQPITIGAADLHDVIVHMDVRAAVSGKVIDTNNAPVAGATVTADSTEEQKGSMFNMGRRNNSAKTAPDGSFKIVGLEAGKYRLAATQTEEEMYEAMIEEATSKDSKATDKKKKPLEVELTVGNEHTGVTITVEARDGVIRGQVIGSDRKPAADTWITARRQRDPNPQIKTPEDFDTSWMPTSEPVLTGTDGKFVIAKLRHGQYTVVAEGPRGSSRAEKHDIKTGDSITLELQPLGTLTGHVTTKAGPVVTYSIECRGPAGPIDRSVSAADGAYSLEHLAPGSYSCSAQADTGTATGKVDVPAGSATLELSLVPWASLTGLVVSMFSGAPVAKISVLAGGMDGAGMADLMTGGGPKTDATGRFTIDRVAAGSGAVMVMAATSGFKPLATQPYKLSDGQRLDLGTIKIVPPRQGDAGTFGMAVGPSGEADAIVVMSVKAGGPAEAAGIRVDDRIKSIDGKTVAELSPMQSANFLSSGQVGVGETVQLGIDRGAQPVTVTITSIKW